MTILHASQTQEPVKAAVLVIAAMALIGLVDNFVVRIAAEAGIWQFHLMRAGMAVPLILGIGAVMGWQVRPLRVWAVSIRGLLLAISMLFYFAALAFLSVAETVAGLFTAPIFVLLISVLWFRQRVTLQNVVAAAIGFTGSLMVLKPDVGGFDWVNVMPIAGGFFYALSALSTRRSCAGESALALLLGFFAAMSVFSCIGLIAMTLLDAAAPAGPDGFLQRGWVAPSWTVLTLTALQAFAAVVGVGLITKGYILADAAYVSVFEYALLVFAAVWGWVLWGQLLDAWGLLGGCLIVVSGLILMRGHSKEAFT